MGVEYRYRVEVNGMPALCKYGFMNGDVLAFPRSPGGYVSADAAADEARDELLTAEGQQVVIYRRRYRGKKTLSRKDVGRFAWAEGDRAAWIRSGDRAVRSVRHAVRFIALCGLGSGLFSTPGLVPDDAMGNPRDETLRRLALAALMRDRAAPGGDLPACYRYLKRMAEVPIPEGEFGVYAARLGETIAWAEGDCPSLFGIG